MTKKPLKEALKEVFRLALFSVPGALILLFTQSPDLAGAYGVPLLFMLRAVDKAIHEDNGIKLTGLSPL